MYHTDMHMCLRLTGPDRSPDPGWSKSGELSLLLLFEDLLQATVPLHQLFRLL